MPSPIRSISDSPTIPDFNLVLFGAAGVGKSSIVRRFLKNSFSEIYRPTVEETYSTVLQTMSSFCVRLVLIDTAGLHPFPAMRELRMRTGSAFIFVFAYDSPDSLHEAIRLHSDLQRVKGEKYDPSSVLFVGNKADLLTVPEIIENGDDEEIEMSSASSRRSSGYSEYEMSSIKTKSVAETADELQTTAKVLIERLGYPLMETSARLSSNILEMFHFILWPMLLTNASFISRVTSSEVSSRHFGEDSPVRRPHENETISKKVSWPWRSASDHPTACPMNLSFSPLKPSSPRASRWHSMRRRKISCVENSIFSGEGSLFVAKEDITRKFSVGSRLLSTPRTRGRNFPPSDHHHSQNNALLVVDDLFNRPASRSHSVDNPLSVKSALFLDTNSTGSAYSGRSYSSLSSVEKENVWKHSVSSNDTRGRHGRFLSLSSKRDSKAFYDLSSDMFLNPLDFVQEVGHYLDPDHKSDDSSEPRVPQVPCLQYLGVGRRGRSPQAPKERAKKRSVFSQSNFSLVDQICEDNEPSSPRSEHEVRLLVPEIHRHGIIKSASKTPNCKII